MERIPGHYEFDDGVAYAELPKDAREWCIDTLKQILSDLRLTLRNWNRSFMLSVGVGIQRQVQECKDQSCFDRICRNTVLKGRKRTAREILE